MWKLKRATWVAQDHYEQAMSFTAKAAGHWVANTLQSLGDLESVLSASRKQTEHYTARDLYRLERHMTSSLIPAASSRVSHAVFDFTGSIEHLIEAVAAKASNAQSVIDYVLGVQGEIHGKSLTTS
jgi:hypothetical protein